MAPEHHILCLQQWLAQDFKVWCWIFEGCIIY